jgi:hemolysin D
MPLQPRFYLDMVLSKLQQTEILAFGVRFAFRCPGCRRMRCSTTRRRPTRQSSKSAVFPATLRLQTKELLVDGKRVKLTPGMNITAEIKTGKRRIIEYLLSPVQRAGSESLRER